jgi:hypothetical protein
MRITLIVVSIAIVLGAVNYVLSVRPRIRAMNERLNEIPLTPWWERDPRGRLDDRSRGPSYARRSE